MCKKVVLLLTCWALTQAFACEIEKGYYLKIGYQYQVDRNEVNKVTVWALENTATCSELNAGATDPAQIGVFYILAFDSPPETKQKLESIGENRRFLLFAEAQNRDQVTIGNIDAANG